MPKKKKNMKELNKKEAIGDLLDAFTEVCFISGAVRRCFFSRESGALLSPYPLSLETFLTSSLFQEQRAKPVPEPSHTQANPPAPAEPPAEAVDETWEEKEDKQNADPEKEKSQSEPSDQKYQYKEGG